MRCEVCKKTDVWVWALYPGCATHVCESCTNDLCDFCGDMVQIVEHFTAIALQRMLTGNP